MDTAMWIPAETRSGQLRIAGDAMSQHWPAVGPLRPPRRVGTGCGLNRSTSQHVFPLTLHSNRGARHPQPIHDRVQAAESKRKTRVSVDSSRSTRPRSQQTHSPRANRILFEQLRSMKSRAAGRLRRHWSPGCCCEFAAASGSG